MEELDFSETSVHMTYIRYHVQPQPPPLPPKKLEIFRTISSKFGYTFYHRVKVTLLKLCTFKFPIHSLIE